MLTISEAARLSGKSRQTIHKYIRNGKISVKVDGSGKKKIAPAELERVFGVLETVSGSQSKADEKLQTVTQAAALEKYEQMLETQRQMLETQKDMIHQQNHTIESLIEQLAAYSNLLEHQVPKAKRKGLLGRINDGVEAFRGKAKV